VSQICRFCGFEDSSGNTFPACPTGDHPLAVERCDVHNDLPCGTRAAPVCASASEPCYFDATCLKGGLGCNAGGKGDQCRFCGFGPFVPCPLDNELTIANAPEAAAAPVLTTVSAIPGACPAACTGNPHERCFMDASATFPSARPRTRSSARSPPG
jgi:hypothetical protein